MKSRYDPVLKVMPKTEYRDEVLFRVAGDGFLEVEYGRAKTELSLQEMLLNIFRVLVVNEKVKGMNIEGLRETVPGGRTNLYKFDPLKTDVKKLVNEISVAESKTQSIKDAEIETRVVRLPLVFDDSEVHKAIEKYVREIKPNAPNCENGSNLKYVARYNGITVEELKQKFLKNEWFVAMVGFFPGLPFYFPLNPTCAVTAPKYNPSRTWTAEGTVDLADFCSTIFGVDSSGGYQLIGRTAPIFQASQKHPQFKKSPVLFKATDIIKYYEVPEGELREIYKLVHEEGKWEYDITGRKFSLREWLNFCEQVKGEAEEFRRKQEYGRTVTPLP